jgi:hypothetical protein
MVPLRGLQLLCCAAVVGIALQVSIELGHHSDPSRAITAFEAAQRRESAMNSALEAANAGLTEVRVVVQRNDTLDQIFRRLELSLTWPISGRWTPPARRWTDCVRAMH